MSILLTVRIFYFLFGTLASLGGAIGFVKAKSQASLIAGLISGALLDLSGTLLVLYPARPLLGLTLGTLVTVLLLGRFAPSFLRTRKLMPAGMMTVLGAISLVVSLLALASQF